MHGKKDQMPIKTKYQCSNHRPDRNTSLATPICSTKKRHKFFLGNDLDGVRIFNIYHLYHIHLHAFIFKSYCVSVFAKCNEL